MKKLEKLKKVKSNTLKRKIKTNKDSSKQVRIDEATSKKDVIDGNRTIPNKNTEKKKQKQIEKELLVINSVKNFKMLRYLDFFMLLLSFVFLVGYVSKFFVNYSNEPSLYTFIFLLLLTLVLRISKSGTFASGITVSASITYFLISSVITYNVTVFFTNDWPWILSQLYYITVPIVGLFFLFAVIINREKNSIFYTRFATGWLLGYWLVKIYLYYTTGDFMYALSYGIHDTVSSFGWYMLLPGFLLVLINPKSRLLASWD